MALSIHWYIYPRRLYHILQHLITPFIYWYVWCRFVIKEHELYKDERFLNFVYLLSLLSNILYMPFCLSYCIESSQNSTTIQTSRTLCHKKLFLTFISHLTQRLYNHNVDGLQLTSKNTLLFIPVHSSGHQYISITSFFPIVNIVQWWWQGVYVNINTNFRITFLYLHI